jgi:hypothetical protein
MNTQRFFAELKRRNVYNVAVVTWIGSGIFRKKLTG